MKSPITTHVLDTALGCPAAGVPVQLDGQDPAGNWVPLGRGETDADGRVTDLMAPGSLRAGVHRITFDTKTYLVACGTPGFYPEASIVFVVDKPEQHYHVPLLLSPYGYSTYRGS